jgi:hypothetical protein
MVQICLYVPMSRNHGYEVVDGRYFHFQSFGNYRKIVFCDCILGTWVPVSLPLVYTSVFELKVLYFLGPCCSILRCPGSLLRPLLGCQQFRFLGSRRVPWRSRNGFSIRSVPTPSLSVLFLSMRYVCILLF